VSNISAVFIHSEWPFNL